MMLGYDSNKSENCSKGSLDCYLGIISPRITTQPMTQKKLFPDKLGRISSHPPQRRNLSTVKKKDIQNDTHPWPKYSK